MVEKNKGFNNRKLTFCSWSIQTSLLRCRIVMLSQKTKYFFLPLCKQNKLFFFTPWFVYKYKSVKSNTWCRFPVHPLFFLRINGLSETMQLHKKRQLTLQSQTIFWGSSLFCPPLESDFTLSSALQTLGARRQANANHSYNRSQSGIMTGSEYHTKRTGLWEESLPNGNLLYKWMGNVLQSRKKRLFLVNHVSRNRRTNHRSGSVKQWASRRTME